MGFGGGGKGSSKSQSSQQQSGQSTQNQGASFVPSGFGTFQNLVNAADVVTSQPWMPYTATDFGYAMDPGGNPEGWKKFVADFNPNENRAGALAQGLSGQALPYLDQAFASASNIGQDAMPYFNNAGSQAQGLYEQFAPFGDAAAPLAGNLSSYSFPLLESGANMTMQASQGVSPLQKENIDPYLSPFQQNVIDATMGNLNEVNAQEQQGVVGNAISKNAWGGDRSAVAQGELARQHGLAAGQTLAGLNQQNYSQALQTAMQQQQNEQTNRQRLMAGAAQAGNIGVASQRAVQDQISAMMNVGQGREAALQQEVAAMTGVGQGVAGINQSQAQSQASIAGMRQQAVQNELAALQSTGQNTRNVQQSVLNAIYQQYLRQQAYPFQALQYRAGIQLPAGGAMGGGQTSLGDMDWASQSQSQSQSKGPSPNPLGSIGGLFSMGKGLHAGGRTGYDSGGAVHNDRMLEHQHPGMGEEFEDDGNDMFMEYNPDSYMDYNASDDLQMDADQGGRVPFEDNASPFAESWIPHMQVSAPNVNYGTITPMQKQGGGGGGGGGGGKGGGKGGGGGGGKDQGLGKMTQGLMKGLGKQGASTGQAGQRISQSSVNQPQSDPAMREPGGNTTGSPTPGGEQYAGSPNQIKDASGSNVGAIGSEAPFNQNPNMFGAPDSGNVMGDGNGTFDDFGNVSGDQFSGMGGDEDLGGGMGEDSFADMGDMGGGDDFAVADMGGFEGGDMGGFGGGDLGGGIGKGTGGAVALATGGTPFGHSKHLHPNPQTPQEMLHNMGSSGFQDAAYSLRGDPNTFDPGPNSGGIEIDDELNDDLSGIRTYRGGRLYDDGGFVDDEDPSDSGDDPLADEDQALADEQQALDEEQQAEEEGDGENFSGRFKGESFPQPGNPFDSHNFPPMHGSAPMVPSHMEPPKDYMMGDDGSAPNDPEPDSGAFKPDESFKPPEGGPDIMGPIPQNFHGVQVPHQLRPVIEKYARQFGVPPDLVTRMLSRESGFRPGLTSNQGAQGIAQLLPGTARGLGVQNPFEPEQGIMGGTKYLKEGLDKYGGDPQLAAKYYHGGPNERQWGPKTEAYGQAVGAGRGFGPNDTPELAGKPPSPDEPLEHLRPASGPSNSEIFSGMKPDSAYGGKGMQIKDMQVDTGLAPPTRGLPRLNEQTAQAGPQGGPPMPIGPRGAPNGAASGAPGQGMVPHPITGRMMAPEELRRKMFWLNMGAGMMASQSPYLGVQIGEGMQGAMKGLERAQTAEQAGNRMWQNFENNRLNREQRDRHFDTRQEGMDRRFQQRQEGLDRRSGQSKPPAGHYFDQNGQLQRYPGYDPGVKRPDTGAKPQNLRTQSGDTIQVIPDPNAPKRPDGAPGGWLRYGDGVPVDGRTGRPLPRQPQQQAPQQQPAIPPPQLQPPQQAPSPDRRADAPVQVASNEPDLHAVISQMGVNAPRGDVLFDPATQATRDAQESGTMRPVPGGTGQADYGPVRADQVDEVLKRPNMQDMLRDPYARQPGDLDEEGLNNKVKSGVLSEEEATLIRGLSQGRILPEGQRQLQKLTTPLMSHLMEYDKHYSATRNKVAQRFLGEITAGPMGRTVVRRGTTLINHMGELYDAQERLNNFANKAFAQVPVNQRANAMRAWYLKNQGSPLVTDVQTAGTAVANELENVFKGQNPTLEGFKRWYEKLGTENSIDQMQSNNRMIVKLLAGQVDSLDQMAKQIGLKPLHILSEQNKKTIDKIVEGKELQTQITKQKTPRELWEENKLKRRPEQQNLPPPVTPRGTGIDPGAEQYGIQQPTKALPAAPPESTGGGGGRRRKQGNNLFEEQPDGSWKFIGPAE